MFEDERGGWLPFIIMLVAFGFLPWFGIYKWAHAAPQDQKSVWEQKKDAATYNKWVRVEQEAKDNAIGKPVRAIFFRNDSNIVLHLANYYNGGPIIFSFFHEAEALVKGTPEYEVAPLYKSRLCCWSPLDYIDDPKGKGRGLFQNAWHWKIGDSGVALNMFFRDLLEAGQVLFRFHTENGKKETIFKYDSESLKVDLEWVMGKKLPDFELENGTSFDINTQEGLTGRKYEKKTTP